MGIKVATLMPLLARKLVAFRCDVPLHVSIFGTFCGLQMAKILINWLLQASPAVSWRFPGGFLAVCGGFLAVPWRFPGGFWRFVAVPWRSCGGPWQSVGGPTQLAAALSWPPPQETEAGDGVKRFRRVWWSLCVHEETNSG